MLTESKCVRCERHCFPNIQRSQLKRGESRNCRSHPHLLTALPQQFPPDVEVVLQFSVSVSHTEQMLEVVTLLRGGPLRVRPAELRNPTLFLREGALWPCPSRAPNPCSWFGSHGQQLVRCTVHPFHGLPKTRPLFSSHGSLVQGFFSGCPYWRTRRRTSLAACAIRNAEYFASHFVMCGVLPPNLAECILRTKNIT